MARLAIALALVLALAALADARSCRNPNTCRNDGECITPKSGKGFECLCAAGFVGERCEYAETPQNWQEFGECTYLVVTAPQLEYADAADACERSGGYLAFIGDDGLNEFLGNALEPAEENKIARWIGLRRDKNNKLSWRSPANTWDDIDSYSAWEPGYPGVNTEDACVFQDTRGGEVEWLVDTCKEKRRYICQRCPTDSDDGKRRRRRNRRRRRRNRRRN